jgi:ribose transport system permease protein
MRIRWSALVASATVAAFAGILYAGTTGAADPVSGQSFLLPTFAAAFLGSTAILPGKFNSWGSFIAVYFLVAGTTGLTMLGAQSFVSDLFYGGALVVAVCASRYSRRKEVRESGSL